MPVPAEGSVLPAGNGTALTVPSASGKFFTLKDSSVLADIETGSPRSLKSAVDKLQGAVRDYTDSEKILLSVAEGILTILYPAELERDASLNARLQNAPAPEKPDPYTASLDSARQGVYDFNRGNGDYLSLVLPSLVLVTAPSLANYYPEAESALTEALRMTGKPVLAEYLLGLLYQRQGRNDEAFDLFRSAYEQDSSCYPAGIAYARMLSASGHPAEGYEVAENLLKMYPDDMEILRLCAETTFAAKDWQLADQYVSQVLQRDPENTYFLLFRSRILVENGEYLKASALLDIYSKTEKTSREYLLVRSRLQKDWNKNLTAASATIQEALQLYPDDPEVLLAAASLASLTGQKMLSMSASDLVGKVLQKDPQNIDALTLQMSDAVAAKDWNTALTQGKLLMSLSPGIEPRLLYIEACIGGGRTAEALSYAQNLYMTDSANEGVQQAYIRSLIASGDTAAAGRIIGELLPAANTRMRSALYYERSRLAASEDTQLSDLRSSLNANPRNGDSLFALYEFYFRKRDYRKAQYYLKQVVALNPTDQTLLRLQTEIDSLLAL